MTYNSLTLFSIIVVLLSFVILGESSHNYKVYVDVNSNCVTSKHTKCGRHPWSAFRNLKEALSYISSYIPNQDSDTDSDDLDKNWFEMFGINKNYGAGRDNHDCFPTIYVSKGVYSGNLNLELNISIPVEIKSKDGPNSTFIDCLGSGNSMRINNNPKFKLEGFTIQKCSSNFGGALFINQSYVTLSNIIFRDNIASKGGAISTQSSSLIISQSIFINNIGLEMANGILVNDSNVNIFNSNLQCANDLYCNSGAVTFDGNTLFSNSSITCSSINNCLVTNGDLSDGTSDDNYVNLCGTVRPNCQVNSNYSNTGDLSSCNYDGICDPIFENCLTCSDCTQCKLSGWKLVSYSGCILPINNQTCTNSTTKLQVPEIINFLPNSRCPVAGILSSYIKVKEDGPVTFRVQAKNMGVRLFINDRIQIDAFLSNMTEIDTIRQVSLVKSHPHTIKLEFFSLFSDLRNISLTWKTSKNEQFIPIEGFISHNVCNDQILDEKEKDVQSIYYCQADLSSINPNNISNVCGDGLCTEIPEECVFDCYSIISPKCPAQAPPAPTLLDPVDTTGMLLNNQYLFSLPGLANLAHGVDILTGMSKVLPIFSFDYCDNSSFSLLQNTYRSHVYTIPKGVYATMTPSCNYNAETTTYSSSTSMAREKASSTMSSLEMNAGGGNSFVKASASVAFTKENSVTKASEVEDKVSGSLHNTEVKCIVSNVHLVDQKLHPIFVRDISHAIDNSQMKEVVKKYGNLYYKSASLGGKISQTTVISEEFSSKMTSSEISNSVDQSYSASVNSPVLSVSVSTTESTSSTVSQEQMNEFEKNSARTTISSYGGPASIYSPDIGNSFARFSEWANEVDLIPVPIDFQLDFIANLIPPHWKVKNHPEGLTIRELWMDAEIDWFQQVYPTKIFISRNMTLLRFNLFALPSNSSNSLSVIPIVYNETSDIYEKLLGASNFTISSLSDKKEEAFPSIIEIDSLNGTNLEPTVFPIRIIDTAMSRAYVFNGLNQPPSYVPHQTVIEYSTTCQQCTSNTYLMVMVKGTKDSFKKLFLWNEFKNMNSFQEISNNYLGTILSVNLRVVMTLEEGEISSSVNLEINSLLVTQTCAIPNEDGVDETGCTPNNVPFTKHGYTNVYQPIDKKTYLVKTISSYTSIPVIYYTF